MGSKENKKKNIDSKENKKKNIDSKENKNKNKVVTNKRVSDNMDLGEGNLDKGVVVSGVVFELPGNNLGGESERYRDFNGNNGNNGKVPSKDSVNSVDDGEAIGIGICKGVDVGNGSTRGLLKGPITDTIHGISGKHHTISGPQMEVVGTQSLDSSNNTEDQHCTGSDTSNIPDQDTISRKDTDTTVDVSDVDNNQEVESTTWWPPELRKTGEMGNEDSQILVGEDGELRVLVKPCTTSIGHGLRVSKGIRNAALLDSFFR